METRNENGYYEWLMGKYLEYGERAWVTDVEEDARNILVGGDRRSDVEWRKNAGWYITKIGIKYLNGNAK